MNDEKELKQEDEIEKQETVEQIDEASMLKNQISDLTEQVNQWKTDYYKVFADMENLKKRLKLEHENALKFMLQDFASDLLPIVDNLQRALGQEASEENKAFLKGFDMITNQLLDVLKKHGVEEIEALGKEFDPNFHQAVMMFPPLAPCHKRLRQFLSHAFFSDKSKRRITNCFKHHFPMVTDKDNCRLQILMPDLFCKLQSRHIRHINVKHILWK